MTAAEDRATAVQLLRAAAADHLTHLEPGERDELVERITGALDRCARHRAAEELASLVQWARSGYLGRLTVDVLHRECIARVAALREAK